MDNSKEPKSHEIGITVSAIIRKQCHNVFHNEETELTHVHKIGELDKNRKRETCQDSKSSTTLITPKHFLKFFF